MLPVISTAAYERFLHLLIFKRSSQAVGQLLPTIDNRPSAFNALTVAVLSCVPLPRWGRSCVRWSRMMEPGNRGWPSSWSRWWPWWLWRAEDRTSQGALGRDPIRNRAVPERRPVPMFFHHVTSSLRLSEMTSSLAFFLLPLTQKIFWVFSSTLLHKLVYLEKKSEGWFRTEAVVLHSATLGFLVFTTGSASRGECLKGGHIGILRSPCRKKRGGKAFYVAFKNLHR